jgi:N-formylglutamate amidohydrolase
VFTASPIGASAAVTPVVLSVAHAGRDHPDDVAAALAVPLSAAQSLEDRWSDLLIEAAARAGHAIVVARAPRLMIDLNRAETDFLPDSIGDGAAAGARPSFRARGGLGLIPMRLPDGRALWRVRPSRATLAMRLSAIHRPWHAAVAARLRAAQVAHGMAILIDVHSMPPLLPPHRADVVIGTLNGRSAAPHLVATAGQIVAHAALRVARDRPYAGAYVLERHGAPSRGVHALQIEIDRRLYLDQTLAEPGPGLAAMQRLIATLADRLSGAATSLPAAAE